MGYQTLNLAPGRPRRVSSLEGAAHYAQRSVEALSFCEIQIGRFTLMPSIQFCGRPGS
jgi:hypothetical protein